MKKNKRRWLVFLTKPSTSLSAGLLILGGILLGGVLKTSFDLSLELTSSNAFCTSCHAMESHALAEMQDSIHVSNRTGIVAECADCHVPQDSLGKIVRKIEGLRELYATATGKIDTPEKYEAHRQAMAEKVWADMRANDSESCRSCHVNFEQNLNEQYEWARRQHTLSIERGQTCIDCHQGIAHDLPKTKLMMKPLVQQ
ncbi:hypothetical protein ACH42_00315 [Endozoicomonas sp. (ex Bugula neritina AB1)]|nr:hypothetical protein ACH42_00315 [Endozoicomonas sp. (ex Bugula neritina AB1)]